ncbi:HAD family hydrolase [uncultured Aquabacterium sp.]|jgi:histidinol-phosphate phosphatase family protein|uniref:D-glycero-alpha-D-manno-heptose-1,7-bisphosphate 7-phosphatase n=1 Tax=uncultured Aquabacterium sp. TaxID=158753 RepID=UPI0034503B32
MALMRTTARPSEPEPAPARPAPRKRAVFLDKDGTLIEDVPYNVDPALLKLTPSAIEGLRLLQARGFVLVIVTNQSGLARRLFDRLQLNQALAALRGMLSAAGVHILDVFVCPHAPAAALAPGCLCRKPSPGLLLQAAAVHQIDLRRSWMVGDILNDVEAGHRAGCRSVLMDVGNETEWRVTPIRRPDLRAPNLFEAAQAILALDTEPAPSAPSHTEHP